MSGLFSGVFTSGVDPLVSVGVTCATAAGLSLPPLSMRTTMMIATRASRPTAPIISMSILLFAAGRAVGTITAGSEKPPPPNTGRSSIEPIADEVDGLTAPAPPPRYALAIERMSIRPEPSPPAAPLPWPAIVDDCDGGGAGLSLASCARLLSENSTEFSLRSPRSLLLAAADADADAAAAAAGLEPNRSPPSSSAAARPPPDAAAN